MIQGHRRKKGTSLSFSLLYVLPVLAISNPVLTSVAEAQTNAEVAPKTPTKTGKAKKTQAKTATKAASQPTAAASTTTSATVTPAVSATQSQATSTDQDSVASKVMKQASDVSAGTESNTENVTVTGSRLLQNRLTNTMATTELDAEQIQKRGYTNIGLALMRENPNYAVPDNSPIGAQQGSFGAGQTFADLLDMGSQRTLTLVNGRRFVSSATSSIFGVVAGSPVDVGNIPTLLIKKVDTVVGSGGPVYGSDAIAGVQNFILDGAVTLTVVC